MSLINNNKQFKLSKEDLNKKGINELVGGEIKLLLVKKEETGDKVKTKQQQGEKIAREMKSEETDDLQQNQKF